MFRQEDLHPETGKYKHILVPANTKSVKVKFKGKEEKSSKEPTLKPRKMAFNYPRYVSGE